jgi:hypothetical protein
MELLEIIEENIKGVIYRLKELETMENRKMYGARIHFHKKIATEMFRSLLKNKESIINKTLNKN